MDQDESISPLLPSMQHLVPHHQQNGQPTHLHDCDRCMMVHQNHCFMIYLHYIHISNIMEHIIEELVAFVVESW